MNTIIISENTKSGYINTDLTSRLFMDRILFLSDEINDDSAQKLVEGMLYLQAKDSSKDIKLFINCPGGSVDAGLAIYDVMQTLTPDIQTYGIGKVASMASILLTAGAKKKRYIYPNCEVLLHQPLGGMQGQASDLQIAARHIRKVKRNITEILAKHTGKHPQTIEADIDRDNWFSAKEAIKYGLVDQIFTGE